MDPRRNPDAAGAVLRGLAAEVALPRIFQSDSTSDEMVAPRSAQGSQLQPRRCARVVRLIGDFRRAFVGRKRLLAGRRRDIRSLTCIPNRAGKKPFEGLDFAEGAVSSHRTGACQQVLGDNFTELRGGADGEIC